jgi:lipopolysaccharide heptosyltransferase II
VIDNETGMSETSVKTPPSDSSILIILMGSLGDVARGLCLVSHIKKNLPESRITWLVEPKWNELVKLHPRIDKVLVFNRPKGILAVWDLYKTLDLEHFDITMDLQRHFKSGFFSWLSGAKRRVGFNRRNTKEGNWLFNNERIEYFSDELPKLRHYLKFTEYLGLPAPNSLDFGLASLDLRPNTPNSISGVKDTMIAVVLGSSWKSKDWFYEGYYGLLKDLLYSEKMQVVLLGDRSQVTSALQLVKKLSAPGLINLVGKTSLPELAAILESVAVAVGPDSGPSHVAAAVGTPYVSLFGPTSPRRTAPYGSENLVIQACVDCAPCYKKQCPGLDRICMRKISVEKVKEKLSEALAMNGSS